MKRILISACMLALAACAPQGGEMAGCCCMKMQANAKHEMGKDMECCCKKGGQCPIHGMMGEDAKKPAKKSSKHAH